MSTGKWCLKIGKNLDVKVISENNDVIQRFLAHLIDKGKSKGTAKIYGYELNRLRDWLKITNGSLEKMTRFDVQQYVNALQDGKILKNGKKASVATIDRIFGTIASFARFINRKEIAEDIRKPKKQPVFMIPPKSLDRNEKNKLFRDVERDGNLRNIAIVYLLAYSGLRVSELVHLDCPDVAVKHGSMLSVIGKENKERHVPYPAEARRAVEKYLESRPDDLQPLFLSTRGKRRLSIRGTEKILEKYGHHPHELRHTFLKDTLELKDENGNHVFNIVEVSNLAGHRSIETTMRYTLPSEKELNEKLNKL